MNKKNDLTLDTSPPKTPYEPQTSFAQGPQFGEHILRAVIDSSPGMISHWTKDLRCTFANKAYMDWFGRIPEQMQGIHIQDLLGEDVFKKNEPYLRAVLRGENQKFERSMRKSNGEVGYVLAQYIAHKTEGEIQGFFVFAIDITERKKAEEKLLKSEEKWRSLVENAPSFIIIIDRNYHITYLNQARGKFQLDDFIGHHLFENTLEKDREKLYKIYENIFATGQATSWEMEAAINSREIKWYQVNAGPIYEENQINYIIIISSDITERKQSEVTKAKLEEQLQQAQKMESVGRLAGGVAHDFNNMLGVIIGHAELALLNIDPIQTLHSDLREILNAAQRSAGLTRQLLAFARKQTISPKALNLNASILKIFNLLQRLLGENIKVRWRQAEELWWIKMDPSQIDQILTNLCVNARDAIATVGTIFISTTNEKIDSAYCMAHPNAAPGEYVKLTVSDTGRGMDATTLSQIFEPFFTTKGVGEGTGLGLATVYGAVTQNHGFITVTSELGKGSTFELYFPKHQEQPTSSGQIKTVSKQGKETLLVVEDEPSILRMATRILVEQGYLVLSAPSGEDALRLVREHTGEIHLLLTDVIMPEMNGRELAKELLAFYPKLKCLFMSGYTADVIARRGMLDDNVLFIQKPFSVHSLASSVRASLEQP